MSDAPLVPDTDILIYQTEDEHTRVQVRLIEGNVWLTQAGLAELFQTSKQNISLHIKNIFDEGEQVEDSVVKDYLTTASDGKRYRTKHYNLDLILAVGYRVRSHRGTQFRRWGTEQLREFVHKGFVIDDDRLKEGGFGPDYFDELLERIRDIRASEKRVYQKVRDLFKLSIDYDSTAKQTKEVFQAIQNKLHFASTGKTAPELIKDRADASKPNMGLTSWSGTKVRKSDVTIVKNYLNAEEIAELNRIVVMYLDYAEDQAKRRNPLHLADWIDRLNAFLDFNDRDLLQDLGSVSKKVADKLAHDQYEVFNRRRLKDEAGRERKEDADLADLKRKVERHGAGES